MAATGFSLMNQNDQKKVSNFITPFLAGTIMSCFSIRYRKSEHTLDNASSDRIFIALAEAEADTGHLFEVEVIRKKRV